MKPINSAPQSDKTRVRKEVLGGAGLSLPEAARKLPACRNGAPVSGATVWRWVVNGIKLSSGGKLHLEACRVSGRWLTSLQALARFIDAQTPNRNAAPKPKDRNPTAESAAQAAQDLDSAGA